MLHPELEAFLDLAEANAGNAPFHQMKPEEARRVFEQSTEQLRWAAPQGLAIQALHAPARDGAAIPLRLYRPAQATAQLPVLVYFHGGGFVVGSLDSHDGVCRELCARAGCAVLAVGYRLAPEHRFPVALEDGQDTLAWLAKQAGSLGLDSARVAFGGDSAGATLATVLAIEAAQLGERAVLTPCAQLLCYPVTDASRQSVSRTLFGEGYLLESDTLEWFYDHYARTPQDRQDWRFSPLLAEDLSGVAPAIVALAGLDPLLDEGRAYVERLREAGVAVEVMELPGLTHDLLRMASVVPDVLQVHERLCVALGRAWG
ncbi:alpha/beta hydrolase [Pseudomonas fluorescens]|uniref:alpha/beta hydrolase n=1 Tax=Pseudomonas fluorescens TaxID=294 RepID=UPI0020C395C1|nr:alpha/beta hydrolase [Pseudomonas fluorescens]UTL92668.1 alpha/beta hydrolase [Pseudomonas fluorescens]